MTIESSTLKTRLFSVAALAFALAVPVAGQGARERSWDRDHSRSVETGATKVIAIQVWADPFGNGREQRFGVAPDNEAVQVWPGERLRLTLVGTGLFNSEGEEVPVAATFNIEAGRDISILRAANNWVEVAIDGDAHGVAGQLGFRVRSGYDMRGSLTNGRITLEARRGAHDIDHGDRNERPDVGTSTRREKSRLVTRALIEGILDAKFDPVRDGDRVEEIYNGGYREVQQFADDLARSVERRRIRLDSEETVRRLYVVLLKRTNDQIRADRGFFSNVEAMRRHGLRSVVRTIVNSVEFRRVFDLNDFDRQRRERR
ncbi:MAG: hypothetical protein ABJC13_08810 [Acidobacteriota bacterium]